MSYLALRVFFTLFFTTLPFSSIQLLLLAIMDDDRGGGESEAFLVCSSPLSTALDTAVLEASSHATDGNTPSFNSEQSNGDYVRVDGKTYLAIDHTANLRKAPNPSRSGTTVMNCAFLPVQGLEISL